jgi:phage replication O-like protein O
MASPQKEKGFTPVAHEILEEICTYSFNASQLFIVMTVWRYTYGFNRIKHDFALSFLQQATQLSDKAVSKELKFLIESKVLRVHSEATKKAARVLSFNKDYENWLVPRRGGVKNVDQLSLFDEPEGNNRTTQNENSEGNYSTPQRGTVVPVKTVSEGNSCTSKKEKDLKENLKEIIYIRFEQFWAFYPKRVGKKDAFRHFQRLHKDKGFSWEDFARGTKAYVEYCQRTNRFLKDGSAFVNQETYKDFLDELPTSNLSAKSAKYSNNQEAIKTFLERGQQNDGAGNSQTGGASMFSLPDSGTDA